MKILIIGGGGREHALAWKCSQSNDAEIVYVAPGNAGTAVEPGVENVNIDAQDIESLVNFCKDKSVGLTIVGPEAPLVLGIVDIFNEQAIPCFGPSKAAAQLEGSKVFTKDFLIRHHIPTAAYGSFTDVDTAVNYIKRMGAPVVVKADGLAAGKGVILARTEAQAVSAVTSMLAGNKFGEAGHRVLIEELLAGEEASFIVMADGKNILPLATSQDHKARDNGDQGPNTGGMGAYSPASVITAELHQRVMQAIIEPTVRGMASEGNPYRGFLYAGLMIAADGTPKVLEFNCRFGDPETQPIMMRLKSDLVTLCQMAVAGKLDKVTVQWDDRVALGVVMAAGGYPNSYNTGDVIEGIPTLEPNIDDHKVFHAGTAQHNDQIITAGGRVLCNVALGANTREAQYKAYRLTEQIHWNNAFYRNDIGYRAIAREKGPEI